MEFGLCPQDVGGHEIGDFAWGDRLKRGIAYGAAGEDRMGWGAEGALHFLHLLLKRLRPDQQRAQAATPGQFPVAGEEDAALGAGAAGAISISCGGMLW